MEEEEGIQSVEASSQPMWIQEFNAFSVDETLYTPILISCKIPPHHRYLPKYVSLSLNACEVSNYRLKIVNNLPSNNYLKKHIITVCVKPLNFTEDISLHLLSWIEMNRLLGANQFYIYVSSVNSRTLKVLEWYSKNGNISEVIVLKHRGIPRTGNTAGVLSVWQRRKYELVIYNDCLYRNIHTSEYVLPVDIDEIIIPKKFITWQQLLSDLFNGTRLTSNYASFSVRNTYYVDNFTMDNNNEISFLKDLKRSDYSPEKKSGKSFVSTDNALVAFHHYAWKALRPGVSNVYFIPPILIQMNHYKSSCDNDLLPECVQYISTNKSLYDPIILKYKKKLLNNVFRVLNSINR